MTPSKAIGKLALFQGYGVEIEYMIVDKTSLNILPITDKVIHAVAGAYPSEIQRGDISWSNELALHVIELKTSAPTKQLKGTYHSFQNHVQEINGLLESFDAQLMPTAMHPWMDPLQEMKLWPHEYNAIYEAYNRIFNCTGHGWANLQSSHLNLPFANDKEFAKLHAAIRFILPILPALSASSPIFENHLTNLMDTRLNVYRHNAIAIPSITGKVIPEVALSQKHYEETILKRMYKDISPLDPDGLLQYEWLNSRGAIARFDRDAIEIRVLDTQECPEADLAIHQAIVAVLKALINEKWSKIASLNDYELEPLYQLFLNTIKDADQAVITDPKYLKLFGYPTNATVTTGELWKHLCQELVNSENSDQKTQKILNLILEQGPLARRIAHAWHQNPTKAHLHTIYRELCRCLNQGSLFIPKNVGETS